MSGALVWRAAAVRLLLTGVVLGSRSLGASTPARVGTFTQEASADSLSLDERTAEVAAQLRCPVCRGQSVLESNAGIAEEMKREVRERLAAGESPEAVKGYFVSRYGEWILLRPPARGVNLIVYLGPLGVLLVGLVVLRGRVRQWVRAGRAAAVATDGEETRAGMGDSDVIRAESVGREEDSSEMSAANARWLEEALRK